MEMMLVFWGLLAGFVTILLLTAGFTLAVRRYAAGWIGPPGRPSRGYVLSNFGFSFAASAAGGYVSAWIAQSNPLGGTLALAIIVLVMAAVSALEQRGKQPVAFHVAMVAIGPVGVLLGGLIRLQVMGLKWAGIQFGGS
ncbi:MAG TPA: hypothetical protein VKB38_12315 [Terracidiphilus sp.]|nr:hypothetical protein [Terracidiphilus sp.]